MAINKARKIIVWHKNSFGNKVFDVFVHKSLYRKYRKYKDYLYDVGCSVAEFVLKINPDLRLLGSEDFEHIPEINAGIRALVEELRREGFEEVEFPG